MAEKQAAEAVEDSARKAVGPIEAVVKGMAWLWDKATKDGYLAAGFRQGLGELGQALKAFPDSIQVHEPGAIFHPTQGEIADAREAEPGAARQPWPSEIAAENRNQPANDNGNSKGNETDTGYSM